MLTLFYFNPQSRQIYKSPLKKEIPEPPKFHLGFIPALVQNPSPGFWRNQTFISWHLVVENWPHFYRSKEIVKGFSKILVLTQFQQIRTGPEKAIIALNQENAQHKAHGYEFHFSETANINQIRMKFFAQILRYLSRRRPPIE